MNEQQPNKPDQGARLKFAGLALLSAAIVAAAAFITFSPGSVVNGEDLGREVGRAAVDEAAGATTDAAGEAVGGALDRTIDSIGAVLGGTNDADADANERTDDADTADNDAARFSAADILGALSRAKDEGLLQSRDAAYSLDPISLDDEWSYGNAIGNAIRAELPIARDPRHLDRVQRLAQPILSRLERTAGRPYTFTIIDQPVVNAFAVLGGHIFIYTGLMDTMRTDAAIQSVIAHEIAHVEMEHCVRGAWLSIRAQERLGNMPAGLLAGTFHLLAERGYSEIQEFEADEYAFTTQAELGVPRQDRLRFVEVLIEISRDESSAPPDGQDTSDEAERPTSLPGALSEQLSRHYRTHPSGRERYDRLAGLPDPPIR